MKIISHLLLLIVGFGLGVWWGVKNPNDATKIAAREAQAKVDILEKVHQYTRSHPASDNAVTTQSTDKVQDLLDQSRAELKKANEQLQGQ